MSEPMTLPVTTSLYGVGAERRTPPIYLVLRERSTSPRALIAEHVREELQQAHASRANSLALHYLLADDPRLQPNDRSASDIPSEIDRACAGLAERRYLLLIDGTAIYDLDVPLLLTERSQVHFVRLLPLIGG